MCLTPLVEIGLTDMPKSGGGGMAPLAPLTGLILGSMSIIRLSSPLILWSFLCLDSLSFLLFFCSLLLVSAMCGCMHYPAKQSLVCLQCSQLASQAVGLPPLSARCCRRMAWRGAARRRRHSSTNGRTRA